MLHCNMGSQFPLPLRLNLEDILGSLQHARRTGELGRLLHLIYWDVRKWARWANRAALAARAADLINEQPYPSRSAFLAVVDDVITELERILHEDAEGTPLVGHEGDLRGQSRPSALDRSGA